VSIFSQAGRHGGGARKPLSGLRVVATLPPKHFFGGNNLVRAREHCDALRNLGAAVYEFDTAAVYAGDLSKIDQQKRDIIEFRPDVAVSTPNAGYVMQGCLFTDLDRRNLFIDELELPVVLYWDHALTQLSHYSLEPCPRGPSDSQGGVLERLRTLFADPRIVHLFPDSGHMQEFSNLGIGSFGEEAWYVQGVGSVFVDVGLQTDRSGFDDEVAFFGNLYLASSKRIPYAADPPLAQLRERARAASGADWRLSAYHAYRDAIAALDPREQIALRLVPDQSFFWHFMRNELSLFMNGDERLRILKSCGKTIAYFGNFNDPDSNAMMPDNSLLRGALPYGAMLATAFQRTMVTVDVAHAAFINGFSPKSMACFAAGGFALTSYKADIARALGPLAEEICCNDEDDFATKLDFFLTRERRRHEVASQIAAIVRHKYSSEALFARTLPIALDWFKARGTREGFNRSPPPARIVASADLAMLSSEPHWIGANVTGGNPAVVETTRESWGYSATMPLAQLRQSCEAKGDPLFWKIEAEVLEGDVGIGLIDNGVLIAEKRLNATDGRKSIYLPAVITTADLMVRNGPHDGVSRIAIYAVFLGQSALRRSAPLGGTSAQPAH
jgi:Glycosyl transferases group 1